MSRVHRSRANHIENISSALEVREDFIRLEHKKHSDGQEYVFMYLVTGDVLYFDIAGLNDEEVLRVFAECVCDKTPDALVTDRDRRLAIGKLFN